MKTTLLPLAILPLLLASCTQIYWADQDVIAAIQQTSLDGKTTVPVIVQKGENGWPRSPTTLAYDKHGNRLLWQDAKGQAIKSVDRATGKLGDWEVALGQGRTPLDLCVDQKSHTVYFSVHHDTTPQTFSIQAASLDTGKRCVVVPKSSQAIRTVDFDAGRNALTYTLANSAEDSFEVWRHSLKSGESKQIVPARGQWHGAKLSALDASGNHLFWTRNDGDDKFDGIWTMELTESGTPKQIVKRPGGFPMEIEWKRAWNGTPQLFWADTNLGAIVSANADGSGLHTVLCVKKASLGKYPTGIELVR